MDLAAGIHGSGPKMGQKWVQNWVSPGAQIYGVRLESCPKPVQKLAQNIVKHMVKNTDELEMSVLLNLLKNLVPGTN